MKKQYWQGAIDAYNAIANVLNILQPIVNDMLKSAKRTSTGKLFQKDKDKINAICQQYQTDKINIYFYESEFCNSFKWDISVSTYYISGEYSDGGGKSSSTKVEFSWYNDSDFNRKPHTESLPSAEYIEVMATKHKELMQKIKELESERRVIERKFGISEYSNFIGK